MSSLGKFSPHKNFRFDNFLQKSKNLYRAFHEFGQVKFANDGLILGLSRLSILPQLPPKILLD